MEDAAGWQTYPSCRDGMREKRACRTLQNYSKVVAALPADQRSPFVCPCCPESPALSLCCTITPCFVPHLAVVGIWVGAYRVWLLRNLIAPPRARPEGYCVTCVTMNSVLLQMRHEVEHRLANDLPIVTAPPAVQHMRA